MGLICAALAVRTTAEAQAAMARAKDGGADLVELRLDLMNEFDLPALLSGRPLPVVVTFRRSDQGGGRALGESERLAILNQALSLGAEYVDVELGSEGGLRRSGSGRVIVSFHDFAGVPADIPALSRRLEASGADIVKIAVAPREPADCLPLYDFLKSSRKPAIAIGMGEAGLASRLVALRFGAFLSYAALEAGAGTAPGQLSLDEMVGPYRARSVSAATRLFCVIGDPIAHSLSPAIHNAAYAAMGLDALYVPFRVPAGSDAAAFLRSHAALGFEGFSVTLPHKVAALAAADEVDDVARKIGAANTISVASRQLPVASGSESRKPKAESPLLHASNTDADAAVGALSRAFRASDRSDASDSSDASDTLSGKTVLVLGAGGAARAVAWGLVARAGARVVVANRSRERGESLARELGAEFRSPGDLAGLAFDAVVNTTPLGMHPKTDATPLAPGLIRPGTVVFDTIYNPLETRLLREAKERGARCVDGLGMFMEQGARQVELWTGRAAPRDAMRRAALRKLGAQL